MHHQPTALWISRSILKDDGKSRFSENAIKNCMTSFGADRKRKGARKAGPGAPRKTTAAQDKQIEGAIYKYPSRHKVTVAWLGKRYLRARQLSDSTGNRVRNFLTLFDPIF
jgi:hypothetical protein